MDEIFRVLNIPKVKVNKYDWGEEYVFDNVKLTEEQFKQIEDILDTYGYSTNGAVNPVSQYNVSGYYQYLVYDTWEIENKEVTLEYWKVEDRNGTSYFLHSITIKE